MSHVLEVKDINKMFSAIANKYCKKNWHLKEIKKMLKNFVICFIW